MAKIQIRIADDKKEEWLVKCNVGGVSLTELIHQSVEGVKVITPKRKPIGVDPSFLRQLASIGNNLNQIARFANRHKAGADSITIVKHLLSISRELKALRQSVEARTDAD